MVSNRCGETPGQSAVSLAMLDSVAQPHSLIRIVMMCALGSVAAGCKSAPPSSSPAPSRAEARQARQAAQSKMDAAREELEQIPPPSKNRYLAVRTQDAYANPFLVVHPQTVTLTIIYKDQLQDDANGVAGGALLRQPRAGRRGWGRRRSCSMGPSIAATFDRFIRVMRSISWGASA